MNTNDTESKTTLSLSPGDRLNVVASGSKPPFNMIGSGKKNNAVNGKPINFLIELTAMSTAELFAIQNIIEKLDCFSYQKKSIIGEVHISTSMFNSSLKQKWKKGLKELKSKELVGSTKQAHFMINPNALIPSDYREASKVWHEIYPE